MRASLKIAGLIIGSLSLIAGLAWISHEFRQRGSHTQHQEPDVVGRSEVAVAVTETLTEDEIIRLTESWTQHSDEIGKYWMNVLDDETGADMQLEHVPENRRGFEINQRRVYATKVLGQMKYLPAIPVLIKHIRFYDKTVTVVSGSENGFVAEVALGQFGHSAVPAIVNAYLDNSDRILRSGYLSAIWEGRTGDVAKTYFIGLHAQHDKRITKEDFKYFP